MNRYLPPSIEFDETSGDTEPEVKEEKVKLNKYGYRKYSKEEFKEVTDNLGITDLGDGAGFL